MDDTRRRLTSHKESKIKSHTMSFKQTVALFAKKNSSNSGALKFNVDRKQIKNQLKSDLSEVDASQ